MKRIALLTVFFYACTFATAPKTHAVAPLALLVPATVGATILAIGGTQYALKNPSSSYTFDGYSLGSSLWAYQKFYNAGQQYLLGKAVSAVLDIKKSYDQGYMQLYPYLWDTVKHILVPTTGATAPVVGDVVNQASFTPYTAPCTKSITVTSLNFSYPSYLVPPAYPTCITQGFTYWEKYSYNATTGKEYGRWVTVYGTTTTNPVTFPPPAPPTVLPPDKVPAIGAGIANAIPANPNLKNDVDNLLKDHPNLWAYPDTSAVPATPDSFSDYPAADPITNADVNNWSQSQAAAAQQQYIQALQDMLANDPTNTALQAELAKALADQSQQEAENIAESYSPISPSGFADAYNPGEYNIPARFTTFLHNVKSSGLFSFSSSFFNSLPSGGSPTLTIEGGQTFGTHTFDFSQALGGGLAILKSVLLACFGFLSIRAVIMKR